jgi:hypothetical protein
MLLSLNPLLKCHNMYCKKFCHRKNVEKIFITQTCVPFGVTRAEKYSLHCGAAQAGWEKASNVNIEQLFQWSS